jgi:hypothetical protein
VFFMIQRLALWILARWRGKQRKAPSSNEEENSDPSNDKYRWVIFIVLMLGWSFLTNLYEELPMGSLAWLISTLILLYGSISFILIT